MTLPDLINGGFEFFAGLFVLLNVRRIWIDKKVHGVSVVATSFFTAWGFWNLYYYPHLDQWLSFFGGISIFGVNFIYVSLLIYYSRKPVEQSAWHDGDDVAYTRLRDSYHRTIPGFEEAP